MTAVTPTDRPKSVRNSCVIKVFGGVFVLSRCFFLLLCGCRGFCHRTESDLFLFLLHKLTIPHKDLIYKQMITEEEKIHNFFKDFSVILWICIHFGKIRNILIFFELTKVAIFTEEIVVSTTRPETIIGDQAIAVHPDLHSNIVMYFFRGDRSIYHPTRDHVRRPGYSRETMLWDQAIAERPCLGPGYSRETMLWDQAIAERPC